MKPLVTAMQKYLADQVYPLHTPGHKGGRGMDPEMLDLLHNAAQIDVSLMNELDDLHNPSGVIAQAQNLAAALYGSKACFWCVNGTTQGIAAMIIAAVRPGEKILIARNSHISVFNALALIGADPIYLQPEYNRDFNVCTQIMPYNVRMALNNHPEIRAVLITSPNYYGIATDTAAIADVCHEYGVPLLVDEAHGAHLGFSEQLPKSALKSGADLVAQSTHKLLGAMTQCSMLHWNSKLVPLDNVRSAMDLLTTTSPNYLLMASLDAAREQLEQQGKELMEHAQTAANKLRTTLHKLGLRTLRAVDVPKFSLDTTKVLANTKNLGITGIELARWLRTYGIAVELADANNVLFLVTYADENKDFYAMLPRLRLALTKLRTTPKSLPAPALPPPAEQVLSLWRVFYSEKQSIPWQKAVNEIIAEPISFYPPGIPVLLPGEKITPELANYIQKQQQMGLTVKGPRDSSLKTVRVVQV